jgi:hypothetical protein
MMDAIDTLRKIAQEADLALTVHGSNWEAIALQSIRKLALDAIHEARMAADAPAAPDMVPK